MLVTAGQSRSRGYIAARLQLLQPPAQSVLLQAVHTRAATPHCVHGQRADALYLEDRKHVEDEDTDGREHVGEDLRIVQVERIR